MAASSHCEWNPLVASQKAFFLSILLKCCFSLLHFALGKNRKVFGNPKIHIRRVTQACGDITRCQGCEALCQSLSSEATDGRSQTEAIAPKLDHQLTWPSQRGENSMNLFSFLKKPSYNIVAWGFLMAWKRFSEFQAFWLTGNRNGNGNKKWNGTQVSTDWTHMGVTAYWISTTFVAVKTPRAEISKTHFFHSRGFFHALPQSDQWKRSSPLPPYFKSWPCSFCSSWFSIFSSNWDFGGKYVCSSKLEIYSF